MPERKILRLLIYRSKRNDWALALLGEDATVVFGYRKTVEACKDLAKQIFVQPLAWFERDGQMVFESHDHPGVGVCEPTRTHFSRLWVLV